MKENFFNPQQLKKCLDPNKKEEEFPISINALVLVLCEKFSFTSFLCVFHLFFRAIFLLRNFVHNFYA